MMTKVCALTGAAAAKQQRSETSGSLHVPLARLAELEIADRPPLGIVGVVHQRAVDPHALGPRVVAERIAVPQHHIRHLARRQRARLVEDAERLGRVAAEPFPGDRFGQVGNAGADPVGQRLGRFLVQPLDAVGVVGMDDRAGARIVDQRDVLLDRVIGFPS